MQESKFNLYGEHIRPNGHQQWDILSYMLRQERMRMLHVVGTILTFTLSQFR